VDESPEILQNYHWALSRLYCGYIYIYIYLHICLLEIAMILLPMQEHVWPWKVIRAWVKIALVMILALKLNLSKQILAFFFP
jgi:hypothetical protein